MSSRVARGPWEMPLGEVGSAACCQPFCLQADAPHLPGMTKIGSEHPNPTPQRERGQGGLCRGLRRQAERWLRAEQAAGCVTRQTSMVDGSNYRAAHS